MKGETTGLLHDIASTHLSSCQAASRELLRFAEQPVNTPMKQTTTTTMMDAKRAAGSELPSDAAAHRVATDCLSI